MRTADSIMWTIKFRDGKLKRFKFPIRKTPEGSIRAYEGKPEASATDLDNNNFFTEAGQTLPKIGK